MASSNTLELASARAARRRLDDAWYLWDAFGDPPAIVRLGMRINDSEVWLVQHGQDDLPYSATKHRTIWLGDER